MRYGSHLNPANRFEKVRHEAELDQVEWDTEYLDRCHQTEIEYIVDDAQSIVAENQSPDVPFRYSLNPYRGCIHACSYCYARPTHEYLGFNAGRDFETKIVVKHDAADLFRKFLSKPQWKPEPITFSGVTDCYQPAERKFQLTRSCLQVALECKQPVNIVTKNALIVRDLDILEEMAKHDLVHVFVSITTLQPLLARDMEPRTSIPAARLRALETLAHAEIPTGILVAPVIPGLNDSEIPAILQAAKSAGARAAGYVLLRLPLTVLPVFEEWVQRTRPTQAEKILGRVRATRDGKLNDSQFGQRMVGTGQIALQIRNMFKLFRQQVGLVSKLPEHNCDDFRPPSSPSGQQMLF
ncbi:MAG: PA0069 family radical SAM protein [Pirellulaceae bacterium]